MNEKVHFKNLDGLRFLAFFSVFMFHSFYTESTELKEETIYIKINALFSNGHLGVNFFFVLSGFLITYLLLQERNLNKSINVKNFYFRRALRIWPLYYLCVLIGFCIFPGLKYLFGQTPNETASPIMFTFFLSNFNNIYHGNPDASILGVLWSVAIEEQFYLLWPLLIVLSSKRTPLLFLCVIIASLVFRALYYEEHLLIHFHTLSVISDMAIGGFLAWCCLHLKKFQEQITIIPKFAIALVYALMILLVIFRKEIFDSLFVIIERLIFSLFFGFVILEQIFCINSFYKIGNWRFFEYWGKYTYGLYCLHFIGILVTTNLFKVVGIVDSLFSVLVMETLIALAITMILSWLSFHYFELFFLKKKEKYMFSKKSFSVEKIQ